MEKFYQLDKLQEFAEDNQEFLLEMIQLFIQNTSMVLKDMETAISTKDQDKLRRLAHSIKSNIRTYGLQMALEPALYLEKDQPADWKQIDMQFSLFKMVCTKAMEQMKEEFALS